MINLAETLDDFIKEQLSDLVIYHDMFPDDQIEGVIARHDPSTRTIAEFIDGTKIHQINISYMARFEDAQTCRETLDSILSILDGARVEDAADEISIDIKSTANVQFVGNDDKNRSIYTCSVTAEYKTILF